MTTITKPVGAERFEGIVQIVIMLAIGTMAGAASFTHVHDVTLAHGQPDWIGWANATVVELMSIALGLELRRRARTNRPTTFVASALVFFVLVSLAAQVVEAERSVVGWLAAALPAIGFLVLAKVVLSRTAATATTSDTTPSAPTVPPVPSQRHVVQLVDEHQHQAVTMPTSATTGDPMTASAAVPDALLPGARILANAHRQATGQAIAATVLAERMRVDNTTAEAILDALGEHTRQHPATERVNGAAVQETLL
jgi:hypothetical protein